MNKYLIYASAHLAQAQAGADMFAEEMRSRFKKKWQKSKSLPRKQKKLMRKYAMLDLQFAEWSEEMNNNLFNF